MPGPHRRSRTQFPGVPYDLGVDKDFDDLWKTVRRLDARVQVVEGGKVTTVTHERTVVSGYELDSKFVVVEADSRLSNAQVLTGTANQVTVAAGTATLSLPQNIHTGASPEFAGLTLTAFSGVLKATAGVVAGSAVHSDLGSIGANDHHNQAHILLSADHSDTLAGTVVAGDIIYGNATPKWARLAKGSDGQYLTLSGGLPAWASIAGGAPTDATYVTLSVNATLSAERVLTGTSNQITVTDNGAGGTVVLSTPQDIATSSSPTFANVNIGNSGKVTIGAGNSATGDVLLNFSIDRAWRFEVTGEGASCGLVLSTQNDSKVFSIWSQDGTAAFSFTLTNAASQFRAEHIFPMTDSSWTLGASAGPLYWAIIYGDRLQVNSTAYWDGASAGVLAGAGSMTLTGKITNYNSVATEGYGVPAIIDNVALTGQTAAIGSTNFTNAGTAGEYRISYYMFCTTISAFADTVRLNFAWNDGTSAKTWTFANDAALSIVLNAATFTQGEIYVRLGSGSVSFSTTISAWSGTPQYAIYLSVERMN